MTLPFCGLRLRKQRNNTSTNKLRWGGTRVVLRCDNLAFCLVRLKNRSFFTIVQSDEVCNPREYT